MTFPPGRSGNPGGRGKGIERAAREEADGWAETQGITGEHAGLRALMRVGFKAIESDSTDPRDRFQWTKMLLERVGGKPREAIDLQVDGPLIDARMIALVEAARMTPHERRNAIAELEADGPDTD